MSLHWLKNIQPGYVADMLPVREFGIVAGRGGMGNRVLRRGMRKPTVSRYWLQNHSPDQYADGMAWEEVELVAGKAEHPDGLPELGSLACASHWLANLQAQEYMQLRVGECGLFLPWAIPEAVQIMDDTFGWSWRGSKATIHRTPETPALLDLVIIWRKTS